MVAQMDHRTQRSVIGLVIGLTFALFASFPSLAQEKPKTIVLGFDGVDARLTQQWMDEGKLPNLARLREQGSYSPLRPTIPSQTPVSWSTFATGLDPGRHGIIDFLKRDPENYRPRLALIDEGKKTLLVGEHNPHLLAAIVFLVGLGLAAVARRFVGNKTAVAGIVVGLGLAAAVFHYAGKWVPTFLPSASNPQQGETFWQMLGDAGLRVRVLRLPQTFPAEDFHLGSLLTGLGTPDLSLRVGKPFFFTSELFFKAEDGGFSTEIIELIDNRGSMTAKIKGPPDKIFSEPGQLKYSELELALHVADDRKSLRLEFQGQSITLKPGEWSDWAKFDFPFNPLISLNGIGRFHLISLEPEIRLYLTPIQFDPTDLPPNVAISSPRSFSADLVGQHGLYKTIGWAIDTWSIEEGVMDEALFLQDVDLTVRRDEQMLADQLASTQSWDVLVHYFEFTDKVSHLMYRLFDPQHPRYDAALAAKFGNSILEAYQRMDKIVGETFDKMPPGTRLFVLSDHGFSSWRYSMNYNTWLAQNGYMTLIGEDPERKNLEDLFDQGDFFVNVDWSRTKAYALGFGSIFLNVEGREGKGIVKSGEYEALRDEIRTKLLAYQHETTGLQPVAHIFKREEAWDSFDPLVAPDLIATNSEGYRAGWQDTLGGIASAVVEPNTKRWSGDHCSLYPPLVPGVLFSNLKIDTTAPYMGDLVPTLLELNQVQSATRFNGKSLLLHQKN